MSKEASTGTELPKDTQIPPDDLKTADDPGSLGEIFDQAPKLVFSGHPALGVEEGEAGPEGGETPPETPPATKPEPPKFEPKHASWEETEKARLEAERVMHERAEEAKRTREENEALKERLGKVEATPKPPEKPAETAKTSEELEAQEEERIVQALDEIGQLDEFDQHYRRNVAKAWRKAGFGGGGQSMPSDAALNDIIDRRVEERLRTRETEHDAENVAATRGRAEDIAAGQGLDMREKSQDYKDFWDFAAKAPNAPFEEQVQWAAGEVQKKKGGMPPGRSPEEKDRGRAAQHRNAPLERGAERPAAPAKPEPFTLGGILDEHLSQRRI